MAEGVEGDELGAMLPLGIDSTGVVYISSDVALVITWAFSAVSAKFSPSGGTSGWGPSTRGQIIGLIPNKAYINSSRRGIDMIDVPNRHTCVPEQSNTMHGNW